MKVKELLQRKGELAEESRVMLDAATEAKREFTAEEDEKFEKIHGDIRGIDKQVERIKAQEAAEEAVRRDLEGQGARTVENGEANDGRDEMSADERRAKTNEAFARYFGFEPEPASAEDRTMLREAGLIPSRANEVTFSLRNKPLTAAESRAQAVGTDSAGGYLRPEGFSGQLEKSMLAFGGMREAARVIRTDSGQVLPWPTVNDTGNSGAILAENTQVTEQDVTYSEIQLDAYKYTSKLVRVSREMLQDSAFDIQSHLADLLGERIARITNQHFTTGTGTAQPNGVVTAASSGVTAAAVDTVAYDEVLELVHSVDPAYRRGASVGFMFSDDSLLKLRQIKDGNGRPIWQPGLVEGEPDRILGFRYTINQDVADMATTTKSVLFGDFNKYIIRDVLGVTLLRLVERYADFFQDGFVAFSRHDGELLDAGTDPIKFITMA